MIRRVVLDTGPLVAFYFANDAAHAWTIEQMRQIQLPLFTCEAVLSEACFLLAPHRDAIEHIRSALETGIIQIGFTLSEHRDRVFGLMRSYRDVPMSFADACLVSMVENLPDGRILTLDSDFRIYRQHGRKQIPLIAP